LGNVWRAGWLFRKSEVTKERVEIIVAIVPRIQPYPQEWQEFEQGELVRAESPLFEGPLCYTHRPWDPVLPDGIRVAKPLIPPPPNRPQMDRTRRPCQAPWPSYYVPHKPFPEQHFYDDCVEPTGYPAAEQQIQPEPANEFVPESDGYAPAEGTIISDQP
jgi:hypothetical protein